MRGYFELRACPTSRQALGFWNNRHGAAQDMLDAKPDGVGATISDLALFLSLSRR